MTPTEHPAVPAHDWTLLSAGAPPELVARAVRLAAATWLHPDRIRRTIEDRLDAGFGGDVAQLLAALENLATGHTPLPEAGATLGLARQLVRAGALVALPGTPGYPRRLTQAWPELGAPAWLYVRRTTADGRLPGGPAVAVVGTRRPSHDGLSTARALGRHLARSGVTVVSGLARGIDQAAHLGALDAGGATVAVLGTGFGVDYPAGDGALRRQIAASGGLVTELPPGAGPRKHHFLWRNRIISGLSDVVVVVEGRSRSGALQTARLAAAQGREVLAVPGSINDERSRGPLDLVRDGARLLTRFEDVLEVLDGLPVPAEDAGEAVMGDAAGHTGGLARPEDLHPTACDVLELLGAVPTLVGDLATATGRPAAAVLVAVADLAGRGLARSEARGVVRVR